MSQEAQPFDADHAHRYFSADYFNRAWSLIEKDQRTSENNEQMLLLAQASLWHWTQRSDCTRQNLSVGHWQLSRVHALLGDADRAREHGRRCLQCAAALQSHLAEARRLAEQITDTEELQLLPPDLEQLAQPGNA